MARFEDKYGPLRLASDPIDSSHFGVYLWSQAVETARTTDPGRVRETIRGQKFQAAEGEVTIDENGHTWKPSRIARIVGDGRYEIVWSSPGAIRPIPYPDTRTVEAWEKYIDGLQASWGGRWANPGEGH